MEEAIMDEIMSNVKLLPTFVGQVQGLCFYGPCYGSWRQIRNTGTSLCQIMNVFTMRSGLTDMKPRQSSSYTKKRNVPRTRLNNDAKLKEKYTFGRELGKGSFGVVYEATHIETQTKWAIKKIHRPAPGSLKVMMLEQEISLLSVMDHAHIIHLKEVYETSKMIYLVTELCVGGNLKQLLKQKKLFTEDETRHIISSLADAVVYLHKRNIMHRDLKLENILLKDALDEDFNGNINIKVIDFGFSVQTSCALTEDPQKDVCGTLMYMAPEMLHGYGYTHSCDVWSIGVIMYILLCGKFPFVASSKAQLLKNILKEEITFTENIWASVSDTAKTVLTYLLKVDSADRMSAWRLLENPWITGDPNMPVAPRSLLEWMHLHLEEEKNITQNLEDLSLSSSKDNPADRAATAETANSSASHAKLDPERDNIFCPLSTSTKQTEASVKQNRSQNRSESLRPRPSISKSHAGVNSSAKLNAKQCHSGDKKVVDTGEKPANDMSKVDNQRPPTSSTNRTLPRKHRPPLRPLPLKKKTKKRAKSVENK